jgi:branched-chain amino acid transport system substrate-binding protein
MLGRLIGVPGGGVRANEVVKMKKARVIDEPRDSSGYSRRQFLGSAAKLAGAALAYPLLSGPIAALAQAPTKSPPNSAPSSGPSSAPSSAPPSKSRVASTIGVLLPQSGFYPQLGASFLAGMGLYFSQAGRTEIKLVTEDVGGGSSGVYGKVDAMLNAQKVDMVVGVVNPSVASIVSRLVEGAKTPFIAAGMGENVPRHDQSSPYIFYHTFGLWEANWALGSWAAASIGRKAVMATSYYDSGYDGSYAFRAGFEGAGGQVVASHVSHTPQDEGDFTAVMSDIRSARPDFVFASYCGQKAADFLSAYSRAGLSGSVPLVGSPFLADDAVLKLAGGQAAGVTSGTAWAANLSSAENRAFLVAYQTKNGSAPDAFSLLGYETARLIVDAQDRSAGGMRGSGSFSAFTSPRGSIVMNAQTHSTSGPLYLQQAKRQGLGMQSAVVSELSSVAVQNSDMAGLRSTVKTGWLATYLCG